MDHILIGFLDMLVRYDEVKIKNKEQEDSHKEAKHGHDNPLLEFHDDCRSVDVFWGGTSVRSSHVTWHVYISLLEMW